MRAYNFTAGPSTLPQDVIKKGQAALCDVGLGAGILEISHRSAFFEQLMTDLQAQLRRLAAVPENYDVLFLQGGATLQFCQIPYCFTRPGDHIDCLHTGFWTRNAMRDAAYYTDVHYAYDGAVSDFEHIPKPHELNYSRDARYVYYCANNSFLGTEWKRTPEGARAPLIADMSSNMMSRPLDIASHALIFASTQKNLGIAGCCVVIVDRNFLKSHGADERPSMFDYARLGEHRSMLNTPPTFAIFMMKEMLNWIENEGGLAALAIKNDQKAAMIRDAIDATDGFFRHKGAADSRSSMTVAFKSPSAEIDERFVAMAEANHFLGLRGHRETGGLRASIFNACPREACEALASFIVDFARQMA